jgi:hypothetical protein
VIAIPNDDVADAHAGDAMSGAVREEKSGKRASSATYQLHERTDRLSLFLFIPTLQFDPESLSKFGHIYVHMCPNMSS